MPMSKVACFGFKVPEFRQGLSRGRAFENYASGFIQALFMGMEGNGYTKNLMKSSTYMPLQAPVCHLDLGSSPISHPKIPS